MQVQLNHMIAWQRTAGLRRDAEQARLASKVPPRWRKPPGPNEPQTERTIGCAR
jgi:hypothetical protein